MSEQNTQNSDARSRTVKNNTSKSEIDLRGVGVHNNPSKYTASRLLNVKSIDNMKEITRHLISKTSLEFLQSSTLARSKMLSNELGTNQKKPEIDEFLNNIVAGNNMAESSNPDQEFSTSWDCVLPPPTGVPEYQKILPTFETFKCMPVNERSLNVMISATADYNCFEPVVKYTLRPKFQCRDMCEFINTRWSTLDDINRSTFYRMMLGFPEIEDKNNPLIQVQNNIVVTQSKPIIKSYLREEVKAERIVPIRKFPYDEGCFAADPICAIPKAEKDKFRFITTGQVANAHTLAPEGLGCPSVETLFAYDELFKRLSEAKSLSVYDYSNFFRQIPSDPSAWRFSCIMIGRSGRYIDTRLKMGCRGAPHAAASVSRLVDSLFNQNQDSIKTNSFSLTLTDDRLVINPSKNTHEILNQINESLFLEVNQSKTQREQSIGIWAGYTIDLIGKLLSLKPERKEKMANLFSDIFIGKRRERRAYASFLGMVWSCRLLVYGLNLNLSPLCFFTRRFSNLRENFYDDSELKKDIYDEILPQPPESVLNEMRLCLDIASKWVRFDKVRRGVTFSRYRIDNPRQVERGDSILLTDSSSKRIGGVAVIESNQEFPTFTFSTDLSTFREIDRLSINIKEYFAAVVGILFRHVLVKNAGSEDRNCSAFIDNVGGQVLLASGRVSLHKSEIAILAKIIQCFQVTFSDKVYVHRISTTENWAADSASRMVPSREFDNHAAINIYEMFEEALELSEV